MFVSLGNVDPNVSSSLIIIVLSTHIYEKPAA